jgi:diadenosine tetraphosphatase ApaH/serine/threonine PP2A family protein phosphatase
MLQKILSSLLLLCTVLFTPSLQASTDDPRTPMQKLDEIISYLLYDDAPLLPLSEVLAVWEKSTVQHSLLPDLAEVNAEASTYFIGDLHGQLPDLRIILRDEEKGLALLKEIRAGASLVFLGDYVDRGNHSVEILTLVAALKLRYPSQVTILRGNHECASISEIYGFRAEIKQRYTMAADAKDRDAETAHIFGVATNLFAQLPVAALVQVGDKRYFAAHGGPAFTDLCEPFDLAAFRGSRYKGFSSLSVRSSVPDEIIDLTWSDPASEDHNGLQLNSRGCGKNWGKDLSQSVCAAYGINAIIRAHQLVSKGIEFHHHLDEAKQFPQAYTVFSASNYCGQSKNFGGIIKVTIEGNAIFPTWLSEDLVSFAARVETCQEKGSDPLIYFQ